MEFSRLSRIKRLKGAKMLRNKKPLVFKAERQKEYNGECGVVPAPIIVISHKADSKVAALMVEYPDTEWLAYLIGKGYEVEDIIIPEQEVSAGSVEVKSFPDRNDVIGVIHSHCSMGNFHSAVDDEYLVGNHNISIVATTDGKYSGKVRVVLPCEKLLVRVAEVHFSYEDYSEWVEEVKPNITKKGFLYQYGKQAANFWNGWDG